MRTYHWMTIALGMLLPLGTYGLSRADDPVPTPPPRAQIQFKIDGVERDELGEMLVEAQDDGKLLLTADGHLHLLQPADILKVTASDNAMEVLSGDEVAAQLIKKLPPGFLIHKTAHFILIYNTSETYARWVGDLYERLYKAFHNFWDEHIKLTEPRFPMVALVFNSRDAYLQFAKPEIGPTSEQMIGYYHQQTNRIVSFDITGVQGMAQPGQRYSSRDMLLQLFSQPHAERTVATVVHEAVHQIAYNCGMQVRLADNPKWVSEGLAMFFEVPDVKSPRGWGTIGKLNPYQLIQFRRFLDRRQANSLTTLISDEARFAGNEDDVRGAYAESWALTFYLIKAQEKKYAAYMRDLLELKPLGNTEARERVDLFKKHFGENLNKLDIDFINFIKRQKL